MNLKSFYPITFTLSLFLASVNSHSTWSAQMLDTSNETSAASTLSLTIVSLLKDDEETFEIEAKSTDTISFLQKEIEKKNKILC